MRPDEIPPEVLALFNRQMADRMDPRPKGLQAVIGDRRIRVIHNTVIVRPATESFHEFLVVVLKNTFGLKWYGTQLKTPASQRHVVMKWISAWHELGRRSVPPNHVPGERFPMTPTGDVQALLALADDLYRLQLVRRLPANLVHRLQRTKSYQGARYEVAAAAVFVRAGCEVDWIPMTSETTCEFTARFASGHVVAVEAKSRHRDGVLHQPGSMPSEWTTDLDNLYRKALHKDPRGYPFVVFLDVNRPHEPEEHRVGEKQWHKDVRRMFRRRGPISREHPAPEALLVLTNWSWHLDGSARATPGEFLLTEPDWSAQRVAEREVRERLYASLNTYGAIPKDE